MTPAEIRQRLSEIDEDILLADGFEDALIGFADGWVGRSQGTVALYDREKCINILVKRDKMDREGAEEYFEFNVVGAYVGPRTPMFATFLKKRS
jgi:hypothetical protein